MSDQENSSSAGRDAGSGRLADSSPLLQALINNVGAGVYLAQNRRFIYVNSFMRELSGYDSSELLGKYCLDFVHPDDRENVRTRAIEALKQTSGNSPSYEYRFIKKDGQPMWVTERVTSIRLKGRRAVLGSFMDIHRRKMMEEMLIVYGERYRNVLEHMQDAYYELDLSGNFVFANNSTCRYLGYEWSELNDKNYRMIIPEESHGEIFEIFHQVYTTRQPNAGFAHKIVRKDGSLGYAESSVSLLTNEKGQPIGFSCVGRDITERKKMEDELSYLASRYRGILDQMQDACYEVDLEGNYLYVNGAMCRNLQYTPEELIGQNYRLLVPEDSIPIVLEAFTRVAETGKPNPGIRHSIRRKDGAVGISESSVALIRDKEGRPASFLCVGRDVTRRKMLEDALRQSEERYRSILDNLQDSYFEVDLKGNFTYVNNTFCRDIGYPREEVIGKNYRGTTPESEVRAMFEAFNQVYRTGKPNPRHIHMGYRKNGEMFYAETSIDLIRDSQGNITGFRGLTRDVTQTHRLQQALAQSEEKYRSILEEMEDAYYEVDLQGNFTFCNNQVTRDTGYTREEFLHSNYRDIVPFDDVHPLYTVFNRVFGTGRANKGFVHRVVKKDGSIIYVEASVSPIRADDGQIIGFRCVSRDVTERKKMEEALARSEEKYRSILEQIDEAYYETDLPGNYIFANEQACRLLGHPMDELIGMNFKQVVPPEDIDYTFRAFNRVYRTGEPNRAFEHRVVKKDGTVLYAEASVTLIRKADGTVTGFRVLSRDVTERKKLEEALRQSEEKYRSILEQMEDSYYEVDLRGNFTFVNDACCRDLGYSREELIGMNFNRVVPSEDLTPVFDNFNQVYRTGEPNRGFSHMVKRKDGTIGYAEANISLIRDKQGKAVGFRAVSRDVTERKKMEQKLAEMATHDYLTGLPNRILLIDRFHVAAAHAHRTDSKLALISLDLDGFKAVNDTLGHSAGDELLRMVAARLSGTVRSSDTVARFGGDEFVLLLQEIRSPEDAVFIAEKLLESFTSPFIIEGQNLDITPSIGLVIYPDEGIDLDTLMRKSDAAMYHSKKAGGNRYKIFTETDREELRQQPM